MPKYELMYLIGSHIADNEAVKVVDEVKKYFESVDAPVQKHEDLGKKKLAYPIKNTKLGQYVVVNFESPPDKVNELEHKVRTNPAIIRHIVLNMEEAMVRQEKDRAAQAKLKTLRPQAAEIKEERVFRPKPTGKGPAQGGKKIQIDLDAEIEKALESGDLK